MASVARAVTGSAPPFMSFLPLFRLTRFIAADEGLAAQALQMGREGYVRWRQRRMMAHLVGLMETLSLTVFMAFELAVAILPERLTYWAWGAAYLPVGLLLLGSALALRRSAGRLDEPAWRRAQMSYRIALVLQAAYMVVVVLALSMQLPVMQVTVIQYSLLLMVLWNVVFLASDRVASLVQPLVIGPALALSLTLDGDVHETEALAMALGVLMIGLFIGVSVMLRRISQSTYELEYGSLQQVAELQDSSESMRRLARRYSMLVAEVGHDLRQPVQAISLAVRTLAEIPAAAGSSLRTIEICAKSLEFELNSMLDYSRLNFELATVQRVPIDLPPLFQRLEIEFAGAAAAKGVRLRADAQGAVVLADPHALYRILGNLVQNALKFTHQGEVALVAEAEDGDWQLKVIDTGSGISPERQAKVFEQFVSDDELGEPASRGLGLGLAIAQRFAENMGTRLQCISEPRVGTQFVLRLPAGRRAARKARPVVDAQALAGRRVLLVDDDRFILDALAAFFRRQGLIVHAATDFEGLPAEGPPPDVVVSDHFLDGQPLGLRGIVQLRRQLGRANLPSILLTGDMGVSISRSCEELDVVLIHKPASPESLLAAMARLLPAASPSEGVP